LAALLDCCDLVVSVANTTVHLAGALGRPTIGLLPYFPGWRWLSKGRHCLWYDSVNLLRQDALGDWTSTLDRISRSMSALSLGFSMPEALSRELDSI
jgi:ADP-heptose:LPS heptosyltransferase